LEVNLVEGDIVAEHRNWAFSEKVRQKHRTIPVLQGRPATTGRV